MGTAIRRGCGLPATHNPAVRTTPIPAARKRPTLLLPLERPARAVCGYAVVVMKAVCLLLSLISRRFWSELKTAAKHHGRECHPRTSDQTNQQAQSPRRLPILVAERSRPK